MFLNLFAVHALSRAWDRLAGRPVRYLLALPLVAVACAFVFSIGFHPPMSTLAGQAVPDIAVQSLTVMAVILPIILLLHYLQQRSFHLALAVAALLLVPVCFISTAQISWFDYQFILAPALRLLHGANVSEIYFQYDLLLSLIGLAWMKLRLDLNLFQVVGQGAYYLWFLGLFAFSRRWFLDKRLAVFLLAALVLVRMYAGPYDPVFTFQTTPLRLDMWPILLLLVYFKGPHHWSAGLFCGLMLLLHHNFGIIYSAAYLQLLLTLCMIDTAMLPGGTVKTTLTALGAFFRRNYPSLALVLMGVLAHYLLFRNPDVQNDFSYLRLRIEFTKIATTSFYWYVVAMVGLSFLLLLRLRARVPRNYLAAGFCLIYLVIGNSLYFFGHSHENALIVLSAALLLLFFLLLDLAGHTLANGFDKQANPFIHRNLVVIVSLVFIASLTIGYGDKITARTTIQARNAGEGQFVYPPENPEWGVMSIIADVKSVTGDNPRVYFVSGGAFPLAYYGGYTPVGYYNPWLSWVSKRGFNRFLQGLVDQGYYLVIDDALARYVLTYVKLQNQRKIPNYLVVWK